MTTLWNDPEIQKTMAIMDPETRSKYQRMGEIMYDSIDKKSDDEFRDSALEVATQIDLMLRDGLDPKDLTADEFAAYEFVYGEKAAKLYSEKKDEDGDDADAL